MSNIHTHHGYHPLFRKQTPFWWKAPSGRRLLAWNGEHYNLGNELGIAGTPGFEYTIQDGLSTSGLPEYEKACMRIEAYVRSVTEQVPREGWCVGWGGDKRVRRVLESLSCHTRTYGLEPFNEVRAEEISYDETGRAHFTATLFGHPLMDVQLAVAGEANLLDALACIAVADICQLPLTRVKETLERFTGAHRRFELTSVTDGVRLYTDYAHNPAEMKTAIHIAAMQPKNTLWAVWQPHTYSRTKTLFDGFVETFDEADRVLITDIMGAREPDPGDLNSGMLLEPMRARGVNVEWTPSFDDTEAYLRAHWQPGDIMISHGCGDIDLLNEQIALHGDTKRD